ncbi:hypothetical protein NliqN6_3359 [Naganishia liquefaciens]|uniref:Uncharacterized protein n=1 Tax=Naganishia liquefaciens TaxID=104408 RepID=A0A8H3TTL9_9TREE|nr:hypothetical protein NliqN6_3359 [Naganishia liquefaciens]
MAVVTEIPEEEPPSQLNSEVSSVQPAESGFLGSLVGSIMEPGVNKALFQAMNFSFLALIITLAAMAFLTSYNGHVLFLMAVSTGLWITMIWFVAEISKVQTQPQNAPTPFHSDPTAGNPTTTAPDLLSSSDIPAPLANGKTSAVSDPQIRQRK